MVIEELATYFRRRHRMDLATAVLQNYGHSEENTYTSGVPLSTVGHRNRRPEVNKGVCSESTIP